MFFCPCSPLNSKKIPNTVYFISTGALIDFNYKETREIFKYAIDAANNGMDPESKLKLRPLISEIQYGNEFTASKNICKFLKVRLFIIIKRLCFIFVKLYTL